MGSHSLPPRRWGWQVHTKEEFQFISEQTWGHWQQEFQCHGSTHPPPARTTSSPTTREKSTTDPYRFHAARKLSLLLSYSELTCPCLFGDKWTTGSCRISLPLGLSRKAGSTFDTAGRWHAGSGIQHRALWCGQQTHPSTGRQMKTACHCIS